MPSFLFHFHFLYNTLVSSALRHCSAYAVPIVDTNQISFPKAVVSLLWFQPPYHFPFSPHIFICSYSSSSSYIHGIYSGKSESVSQLNSMKIDEHNNKKLEKWEY